MVIKFQSKQWVTLLGKDNPKWLRWAHRNTHLRVNGHAFNLTTNPAKDWGKISYSHSVRVRTSVGHEWVNKTSKHWF